MKTKEVREWLNRQLVRREGLREQVERERDDLQRLTGESVYIKESQEILQSAAEFCQETAHRQVADIVTRCLQAVFLDSGYEFRIAFEQKRGKTEARLAFVVGGKEVDPIEADAGGGIDVASFALRLASLILSRPPKRRLLILDEPFKHLSKRFRSNAAELLVELSKELSTQIVLVTHAPELEIGKVIRFTS